MSNRCEFTMYIMPPDQTNANLRPAVGGLNHLVTIDATRTKIGE